MTATVHKLPAAHAERIYADTVAGRLQRVLDAEATLHVAYTEAYLRQDMSTARHLLAAGDVARVWLSFAREWTNTHPEVGVSMTYTIWTDRVVYEITRVNRTGTKLWARRMRAKRVDDNGMSATQRYVYVSDPDAPEQAFSYRKAARVWKLVGDRTDQLGGNGRLGLRSAYHDFSF